MSSGTLYVQRWNWEQRLQHALLFLSMFGLLGTGLPIKYGYTEWAARFFVLIGGFRNALIIHKVSAVLLVVATVVHAAYLLRYRRRHGPTRWEMMFSPKDLSDANHHAMFLLGLRQDPPRYDRYSYLEKFEYLAIFWGLIVMGATGMSIWFPSLAANWVPRWVLDAFRIIHSNEAFVAMLSLAFGHFFFAHFSPLVFPSSTVWLTGKISVGHLREEHPMEYDRLVEQGVIPAGAAEAAGHGGHTLRLSGWRRALGIVEMLIYSAIFYWLLVTFIPLLLL